MTRQTVVSLHAHPDDEVLLTGGALAQASSLGHRTIIVHATDGAEGLAAAAAVGERGLGEQRRQEARAAAAALGCEVIFLGYADSGMDGRAGPDDAAFSRVAVEAAAERLAELLSQLNADALTVYDAAGGYGHPDHIAVHQVGVRAARLAGVPRVLEATVDRRALLRALRIMQVLHLASPDWHPSRFASAFARPDDITHRIDVKEHIEQKRRAMAAHVTQSTTDDGRRALERFLQLPDFAFRKVFGREWFIERGRTRGSRPITDLWTTAP